MSEIPGPDVAVIDLAPAQPAPIAIPSAAISSSACTTANVAFPVSLSMRYARKYSISVSHSDDDGVMGYHVTTVTPATGFRSLRDLILQAREATLPVLSPDGQLVGLLTAEQIRPVMDDHQLSSFVVAGDIAIPPVFVHPDDDLYRAHELFRASGCPQIPVLEFAEDDSEDRGPVQRVLGMLDYRDMMRAYGRELARRREG